MHLNTEADLSQLNSPTASEDAMIQTLKQVPDGYQSDRHKALKSELKIRMLLAKEKLKNPKEEHFAKRQKDLQKLYEVYKE